MKKLLVALCCFCLTVLLLPAAPQSAGGQEFTGYSDVSAQAWSYNFVYKAQREGFFDAASSFHPQAAVTRAQLAKFVYKIAENKGLLQSGVQGGIVSFADVEAKHWASAYIQTVASLGLMTGYADEGGQRNGRFGPDDPVTRAQVAKAVSFSSGISLPVDDRYAPSFPDVSEEDWFFEAVRRVTFHCVMTGYESGFFGAMDSLTREQVAKVIVKTLAPGCGAGQKQLEYVNTKYLYSFKYPIDHAVYSGLDVGAKTFFPASATSKKVLVAYNDNEALSGSGTTMEIFAVETGQSAHEWLRENLVAYDAQLRFDGIINTVFQRKTAAAYHGNGEIGGGSAAVVVVQNRDVAGRPVLLVLHVRSFTEPLDAAYASLALQ